MRVLRLLLACAAVTVLTTAVSTVPAHAARSDRAAAQSLQVQPADVRPAACNGQPVEAFDYTGCMKANSHYAPCVEWPEVFVIAPDRTIWHAWPGSGGWKQMHNNGLADDTWACFTNVYGQHQVEVCLYDDSMYYSYLVNGVWKGWNRSRTTVAC
jgi:hypothetical protein